MDSWDETLCLPKLEAASEGLNLIFQKRGVAFLRFYWDKEELAIQHEPRLFCELYFGERKQMWRRSSGYFVLLDEYE